MKWSSLVIGAAATVLLSMPAAAQQSLGDVAGSIKLKKPEGESVVIDSEAIGQKRGRRSGSSGGDLLLQITNDCLEETRALSALVNETRGGDAFYQDEWRERVAQTAMRFGQVRDELGGLSVDERYAAPLDTAIQGSDVAASNLALLQSAIESDRPVFSQARTGLEDAIRQIEKAKEAMGAASRAGEAESNPGLINPIDAERNITALCRRQYTEGSDGFSSCVATQRAAVVQMTGRTAPGVGLADSDFNRIRNSCRFEWPSDYVNQNKCEQRRTAAKSGR